MKKTLFDISEDMLAIGELLDNFDGDVSDSEVEALIERLFEADKENQDEFDRKVDSYIWLIKDLRNDAAGQKAEADRLSALSKRNASHADYLAGRLEYIFKRLGIKERKTKYHHPKFGLPGGKQALEIDLTGWSLDGSGEDTPVESCYVKTTYELNKDAVREELENGGTLPFAKLKEKEEKLKIK